MDERRKSQRIDVSFPIECRAIPSTHYFYTVSKDISQGGAKIITNEFIPRNNLLKVNLNIIDKVLNLKAKVTWCAQERLSDRYSTGLEFVEVNESTKEGLKDFLSAFN